MKLPPYGKPLFELLKNGGHPKNDVNLFVGNKAWDKGKGFSVSYPTRTLILPPWHDPFIYFWPVENCDVLISDTGYADDKYLTDLAGALYQHGASIVRCINPDFEIFKFAK